MKVRLGILGCANIVNKHIIKALLKKYRRDRIPLGGAEAKQNDDVYIRLYCHDKSNNEQSYYINKIEKDMLKCSYFNKDDAKKEMDIDIKEESCREAPHIGLHSVIISKDEHHIVHCLVYSGDKVLKVYFPEF